MKTNINNMFESLALNHIEWEYWVKCTAIHFIAYYTNVSITVWYIKCINSYLLCQQQTSGLWLPGFFSIQVDLDVVLFVVTVIFIFYF